MASQSAGPSKMSDNDLSKKGRPTASQFFNQHADELPKQQEPQPSIYDRVVELINSAAVMQKGQEKISNLKQVQELIIHNSSDLLDNFLDEMLGFQSDRSNDVKKFIVTFMEEACKKDNECLPKVLPSMVMLIGDDDVGVQKKVILTVINMVKLTLGWIIKAKKTRPVMSEVWNNLVELKSLLYDMLESVNDGIRTHVVKFLEGMTLVCSRRTSDSDVPKNQENELSLEQVPNSTQIIDVNTLEEYGIKAFNTLLQFQASPHVSSINLMTVMNALSNIGKQRPQFFDQIVQSYEALHVNLPPTLAKSQVSSVRKNLKNQLLSLLKHPCSVDFMPQVTTLLTDLGSSQSEIAKNMPKDTESRKRKAPQTIPSSSNYSSKKTRVEIEDDDDDGMTPWVDRTIKKPKPEPAQKQTAIDMTAEDILPKLSPQNVADLVLLSMVMLPETMPAQFQSTYTPIAAAGTEAQIGHIARLLATQLTMAGLGRGIGELQMQAKKEAGTEKLGKDEQPSSPKQLIQTVVGRKTDDEPEVKKPKMTQLPLPPTARKMKHFQLSVVTKSLAPEMSDTMLSHTLTRIIEHEKPAVANHVEHHRTKVLSLLTSLSGDMLKDVLQQYIFDDVRHHQDLCFAWLYQEYANCQGYSANPLKKEEVELARYDDCLYRLLVGLLALEVPHADSLFHRILLEAPIITDNSISIIRKYCSEPEHTEAGMVLLTQLINNRPAHRLNFLDLMLEFTSHNKSEVRSVGIKAAESLHASGLMQSAIEKFATGQLKKLLQPKPPQSLAKMSNDTDLIMLVSDTWTEDIIKAHLYLLLALLPSNHKLIHELANIYTATTADIKRTILRVLEAPVRGMGMDSPELLTLVENCPKGSETLVMRVIHILTDKAVPSPELVDRIRDLYHKRVPDVRFLIPVLNGLSKNEVMEALPKLIKLNPLVVKEVFNRLMGSHVNNDSVYHSPLTPVELLVALHNIDPAKCDMKTIIKAANLCLSERHIYSQEVMALVMQKLMEIDPLPTLLMRTVIQSLTMYPRLLGNVLNILQRLIVKKVWKQKKVWEGFIRCCQRTQPQSFQVLLQLPPQQLKDVFELCPDMRAPLLAHVHAFTDNQRAHINPAVLEYLKQEEDEVHIVANSDENKAKEPEETTSEKDLHDSSLEKVHRISSIADPSSHNMGSTSSPSTKISVIQLSKSSASEERKDNLEPVISTGDSRNQDEKRKENKDPERAGEEKTEEDIKAGDKDRRDKAEDDKSRKDKSRSGGNEDVLRKEKKSEDRNNRDKSEDDRTAERKKEEREKKEDSKSEKDRKSSSKSSRREDSDDEDAKTKTSSRSSKSSSSTSSSSLSSSKKSSNRKK